MATVYTHGNGVGTANTHPRYVRTRWVLRSERDIPQMKIKMKDGGVLDLAETRKRVQADIEANPVNARIWQFVEKLALLDALEAVLRVQKTKTPYGDWCEAAIGNQGNYDDCASAGFDVGRNDAIDEVRDAAGMVEE